MANYSALAAALTLIGAGLAAPAAAQPKLNPPPVRPNPVTQNAMAEASKAAPFPTFAQIPPMPTDVRSMAAWKVSVTTLKAAGARLTEMAANEPWTLGDTEDWAERHRTRATPPPPVTTASQADTEAFAAAMRARAMPPPRKR